MNLTKKFESLVQKLEGELALAWTALVTLKQIREWRGEDHLPHPAWFYHGVTHVCKRELFMILAKVVIPNPSSITLKKLLDHVEMNAKAIKPSFLRDVPDAEFKDEVLKTVREQRAVLDVAIHPIIERINLLRDTSLAHLDNDHINSPHSVAVSFTLEEVEDYLKKVWGVLSHYSSVLHLESLIAKGEVEEPPASYAADSVFKNTVSSTSG
jgi:hypothetical protein